MKRVFIDAGHGGKDNGATGQGLREKDITLSIAKKVENILLQYQIEVRQSRVKDNYLSLDNRAVMSNKWAADIFISIHVNDASNHSANGIETFSYPGSQKGRELAKAIQNELVDSKLWKSNRGIKTANFAVLRQTKATAALVELGFINNTHDSNILKTKEDLIAELIANGILNYLKIPIKRKDTIIDNTHWAEKHYNSLSAKGITIHEKRYDDTITRAEVFALLDRIISEK